MTPARLEHHARSWAVTTAAQVVPMVLVAALLFTLHPVAAVVGVILLAHAWAIPELYANRGAKVVKPRARMGEAEERTALGLLGDLVGHEARGRHPRPGQVLGRGAVGGGVVGEAGALLVRGRRVHCWCVRVPEPSLPSSDRIAHLLLALREDEQGFATVANHAFVGARWRVRRRLPKRQRPALEAAARAAG
jgi:hypothetical protein